VIMKSGPVVSSSTKQRW